MVGVVLFSPSPLIPLPSRERGCRLVLSCCRPALWILDQVQNDGEGGDDGRFCKGLPSRERGTMLGD